MIGIGNKGISDLRLGSKSVSAAYLGINKVWPRDSSGITLLDYIQTDGACRIPLLNVKPKQDMVIVSSFYVARDPEDWRIFYGTEDGVIQMFVYVEEQREIISWGYKSDGKRNISFLDDRPSEPTFYLLKQNFKGSQNYTAFYSNSGSPYLHSSLDDYMISNPNTRFYYGNTDNVAFPSDQNLSIFGVASWSTDTYMVAGSRFYGMKIWSGGNLVHDLVPAKRVNEYGIYDAVTGTFHGNAGTGTLTGGNPSAVAVTGVSLNKTSLSLVEGGSETLLATVSPSNATNKSVTWSSSDDSVATVDANGKVTAVKAGTATITVRTVDGGKTASCSVNVTAATVAVTLLDYIQTDGACRIPLLNVKPAQDMEIVSSFYVARDPGNYRIFYGTEDGVIQMFVNAPNQQRRIYSYGYDSDGKRNISYCDDRPSEPTHYLLKQDFSGAKNYTAYYSNGGSPYLSSSLDAYQTSNPNIRFKYSYNDITPFPSDQNLSIFGVAEVESRTYMVAGSRFYGMKIWSGGNLVHDLVPAKKAAEYGIYDAVTQDFYANAGTGTLTGGNI